MQPDIDDTDIEAACPLLHLEKESHAKKGEPEHMQLNFFVCVSKVTITGSDSS